MDNDINPVNDGGQGDPSGINPAWNDFLSVIPEEHHSAVIPHLENWDKGVQRRFQDVQSGYAPYKTFLDNKIDPNELQMGYGLLKAIADNPQQVMDAIRTTYNLEIGATGQGNTEDDEYENLPDSVKAKLAQVDQLQNGFQTMSQALQHQEQQRLEEVESVKLEKTMQDMKNKYGDFDEETVLNFMLNGYDAEQAVQRYQSLVDNIRSQANRPTPFKILGTGGSSGNPGTKPVDPKKLNEKDTRSLIAKMMDQAAQSSRD